MAKVTGVVTVHVADLDVVIEAMAESSEKIDQMRKLALNADGEIKRLRAVLREVHNQANLSTDCYPQQIGYTSIMRTIEKALRADGGGDE